MAEKNIKMRRKLADGNYDDYFPETKAANVKFANGTTVEEHLAESATDAHNATAISVADTANHFTGVNVETVLAELFTFANDGKTGIASVVGSPATPSDTFGTLEGLIQTIKNTLASNLTNKGQSSIGTEALAALADKVANVNTGKKWAMVEVSHQINAYQSVSLTVNGLDFTPSFVIFKSDDTKAYFWMVTAVKNEMYTLTQTSTTANAKKLSQTSEYFDAANNVAFSAGAVTINFVSAHSAAIYSMLSTVWAFE